MGRLGINGAGKRGLALAGALVLAGCAMPSAQYGLAPIAQSPDPYPNINADPTQKQADPYMNAQQRADAEADMLRKAGKLPAKN
jgi:hypothetical protein